MISPSQQKCRVTDLSKDPRYWHGLVSMAAVHRRGLWLGQRQPVAYRHLPHLYIVPTTLGIIADTATVTPIDNEFNPSRAPILTLSQNIGLLCGAIFWGFGCDVFGRR